MHKRIKLPQISITKEVFDEIRRTIGAKSVETGGVLGGDPVAGQITDFFFDAMADRSPIIYTVAADRINPVIEEWNKQDIHLCGMIHSHPRGLCEPSLPDVEFALRLLKRKDNFALPRFLIPIVQSAADGSFSMRMFAVIRDFDDSVFELPFQIVQSPEDSFPVASPIYRQTFTRVCTSYDLRRLNASLVIIIGCGGAVAFVEDLARCGVGHFILIDPDVVQHSNLATSGHFGKDVGRPKVDAVRDRILDINRLASVKAITKPIEAFSDSDFRDLVFDPASNSECIVARLLCGMTDSFWAQWRVNLLALNFSVPAIFGQIYRGGRATELVFTHPDTTQACARCILSQRFLAYLEQGFQNDAGSEGAQYVATVRLNESKLYIALAILHHGTRHPFWGPMLQQIGQRNFILGRIDPNLDTTLGLQQFKDSHGAFADDCVWRPQTPENHTNGFGYNCPDCGGTGNLRDSMGKFDNTASIVSAAKTQAAHHGAHDAA